MTTPDIAAVARGMDQMQRRAVLVARWDGDGFLMPRGIRGLCQNGVCRRSVFGIYLSEIGLAVRAYLENDHA